MNTKDSAVLVTGGAGFIGSHLVERLLAAGRRVIVVDSLVTGQRGNLPDNEKLTFLEYNISELEWTHDPALDVPIDRVFHLACPPSPVDFARLPVEICLTCSFGTKQVIELAVAKKARLLYTSTSEVYGDPLEHPQVEEYRGNVSTDGPRSCYDEGKRFGEALIAAYRQRDGLDARVVRVFNTYGPRMRHADGRVVPAFLDQALDSRPLTVFGDGNQTRSFCYVDDLVNGILALMESDYTKPVNLGNPDERTICELAKLVIELTNSKSGIERKPLPTDDPKRRRPDITTAKRELGWEPKVELRDGLARTVKTFRALRN